MTIFTILPIIEGVDYSENDIFFTYVLYSGTI